MSGAERCTGYGARIPGGIPRYLCGGAKEVLAGARGPGLTMPPVNAPRVSSEMEEWYEEQGLLSGGSRPGAKQKDPGRVSYSQLA